MKEIQKKSFPFVAIGGSAGGFEALSQLLSHLPANSGMAFIYVQHLSPDYKSELASLLSRSTSMKVLEAEDDMEMLPNHLVVIPPNTEMFVLDGKVKLLKRNINTKKHFPIDVFFTSIAEVHKKYVIGILLSGTGSDGALGMLKIKREGGLTMAQDYSAVFSSMPDAAIAEGAIDFVLSPVEMATSLVRLSKSRQMKKDLLKLSHEQEFENSNPEFKVILQILYKKKGIDFSHYKMNTIRRRIIRRMQIKNLSHLKSYAEILAKNSDELEILSQDLLINVSFFFREPDTFSFLKNTLFPKIIKDKSEGDKIRIWVPACATGEEVYSIAITMLEVMARKNKTIPLQIFASDLSAHVVRAARLGDYSEEDVKLLTPQIKARYFEKHKDRYRVGKKLREVCVFAHHNILSDPSFSHIDFISCCNLLIYLDAVAQRRVISTFHYALEENGFLMLSKSESVGDASTLFSPIHKKFRLYIRKKNFEISTLPSLIPRFSQSTLFDRKSNKVLPSRLSFFSNVHKGQQLNIVGQSVDDLLLSHYVPACVLINYTNDIIEFRGASENFLRHASGKASFNIVKMSRPEYFLELRAAILLAKKTQQKVLKANLELKGEQGLKFFNLEVVPLNIEGEEPLLLVVFGKINDVQVDENTFTAAKKGRGSAGEKTTETRSELMQLRAATLTMSHEHELTVAELQSANEEVVSNNEELRTLNEELETSKEEIESANEELLANNQKLHLKNNKIEELNRYSEAIIVTMHNPMVVLDKDLRIRNINKPFCDQFNIEKENALGEKFYEVNHKQWKILELRRFLEDIIPKNIYLHNMEITHRFDTLGEKTILVNARRVQLKNRRRNLILLILEDVSERASMLKKEKLLIENLQRANVDLEHLNTELTSFSYASSHDLQEPLRKIRTFAAYILKEEEQRLSDSGKDYFRRMQNSVNHMQTLVEDLLSYSQTSLSERKFETIDLSLLIEEVKAELVDQIAEKKATISSKGLCKIKVIRFQFRQLMSNLIGNALKFASPDRLAHITIECKKVKGSDVLQLNLDAKHKYCQISVCDNGIGFDAKYKSRIFDIFERLHSKEHYKGTGIGLAICKKIVKNHGGLITADGELNKGACFIVYLPL